MFSDITSNFDQSRRCRSNKKSIYIDGYCSNNTRACVKDNIETSNNFRSQKEADALNHNVRLNMLKA